MNLNKVLLIGRLTVDPQLRTTSGGQPVASFSLATNRVWTDKSGQRQEDTEFHNIVVWGRQAEIVNQFLNKGSLALIEGRLQTRTWEGKDGQSRRTTEIVAERVQFGPRSTNPGMSESQPDRSDQQMDQTKDTEDDIPDIDVNDAGDDINPEDIPF